MSTKARVISGFETLGLDFFVPILRLVTGDDPAAQTREIFKTVGVPILALGIFLMGWSFVASNIETSIGAVPGPAEVWHEAGVLVEDHRAERAKEVAFYERMETLKEKYAAEGREWKDRSYSGKPTYFDQIVTSLQTVFAGFLIASLIAVPIGILCGLSTMFYAARSTR